MSYLLNRYLGKISSAGVLFSPPGEGKTYSLALGEDLLTNPSATLGSLIQHGNHLKLSLVEQFTQG